VGRLPPRPADRELVVEAAKGTPPAHPGGAGNPRKGAV